ncbi:MAG: hypothetical protein QCI00_09995 [Candidatus Thermoplasmatota archaeon]|nr:hypothetical protein [Candidatus Thermoplasmatota archaeon]
MKEIKIKIDEDLFKKATELGIDIDNFFISTLKKRVNERIKLIEVAKNMKKMELENKIDTVFRTIKKEIKKNNFDHVYKGFIISELENDRLDKSEIENILNLLEDAGVIKEEPKNNYKILKKKYKVVVKGEE